MEIVWGDKTARWFISAGQFTGYHDKLSELLIKHIEPGHTLCDLGCGIGLIDFALSPYLSHITCVDTSAEALALLRAEASRRGINNITAVKADAADISGMWDYGLMLFFHGKLSDHVHHYLHLFKRRLLYIVHADSLTDEEGRHTERAKCSSISAIREEFKRLNVVYELEEYALEYGQPFESLDEAVDFALSYKLCPQSEVQSFLKDRLEPVQEGGFRYYLPHTKRFGMFIIGREENAHI